MCIRNFCTFSALVCGQQSTLFFCSQAAKKSNWPKNCLTKYWGLQHIFWPKVNHYKYMPFLTPTPHGLQFFFWSSLISICISFVLWQPAMICAIPTTKQIVINKSSLQHYPYFCKISKVAEFVDGINCFTQQDFLFTAVQLVIINSFKRLNSCP